MNKSDKTRQKQLGALSKEFRELLVPCLEQCARGRWGLFGTFDSVSEARRYWDWPEADRLKELAVAIQSILSESGEQDPLCTEFLRLCTVHGPNDPGEPRIAGELLEQVRRGSVHR